MRKIKKTFFYLCIPAISVIAVLSFSGCTKDTVVDHNPVVTCDVRGTYTGISTASAGNSSTTTYKFQDNNFISGSITPTGTAVSFGGYKNTCDSVSFYVYYVSNNSYYLHQGKLTNNRATISGTFKNLTTPTDFGTFTISK